MKSIKRTYLRKRSELKRYISRLAMTEFGNDCGKVLELDIDNDNNASLSDELDKSTTNVAAASSATCGSTSTTAATTSSSSG